MYLSSTLDFVTICKAIVCLILSIPLATRLWTTAQYHRTLQKHAQKPHSKPSILEPPQIPYSIPWLGNSLTFINSNPGLVWKDLFRWHPRSLGALTLLLGGRRTHFLYAPSAIDSLLKARSPSRSSLERDLFHKVFAFSKTQIDSAERSKHLEAQIHARYMSDFDRVNELTERFLLVLNESIEDSEGQRVGLYAWLRKHMFASSVTALMGEKLLEKYPEWEQDFFEFDKDFLLFFFQKPTFLMREATQRRERIFWKFSQWSAAMRELSGGKPVDPEGPAWEPYFGSRLNRARQINYRNRSWDARSAAALDVGLTFGVATNAIPAAGWMLFHILDPKAPSDLIKMVRAEIKSAQRADGSFDIACLVSQPVLQSIWTEVLRFYVDFFVARILNDDIMLTFGEDDNHLLYLRKGDSVLIPTWLLHRDPKWDTSDSPGDVFDAMRFLGKDEKTGQPVFTLHGFADQLLPFGGGRTVCPGRVLAKNEVIAAVATILTKFDLIFQGFVDGKGESTGEFPGLRKTLPGSGVLNPDGDMLVEIKLRT